MRATGSSQTVSLPERFSIGVFCLLLTSLLVGVLDFDYFNYHLANRLEFWARKVVGQQPKVDERLKILVFDNKTVSYLNAQSKHIQTTDLPLKTWATVLEAIDKQGAEFVFIDKIFENPWGVKSQSEEFVTRLSALNTKVVASAYIASEKLPGRQEMLKLSESLERQAYVYGPHQKVVTAFDHVGHISSPIRNRFPEGVEISDGIRFPHWTSFAAKEKVPQSNIINLVDRQELLRNVTSMSAVIQDLVQGKSLTNIGQGDFIMILPSFYTGSTDFHELPMAIL